MKLIELKQAQKTALSNLKKRHFEELQFYTFKKDRSVIIQLTDSTAQLIERGYHDETINLDSSNAKHLLKTAFSREFPRSHKVYFSSVKMKK